MSIRSIGTVPLFLEPHMPNWEMWSYEGSVLLGVHRWAQLLYELEVKPHVLETDPGPLDARVP